MTDFDLTKITMQFGTLRRKIRTALQAHFDAGGEIEVLSRDGIWVKITAPSWIETRVYRAKPTAMITGNIGLSDEYRAIFVGVQERAQAETQPHPIFAAVKEWQEAHTLTCGVTDRRIKACAALMAIKVPS